MLNRVNGAAQLLLFIFIFSTSSAIAKEYKIDIQAENVENNSVKITAASNIPGTIEVFGGVNLASQGPDDIVIGTNEKFFITDGIGQITIDVSNLPTGNYNADIVFYPRWGFTDDVSKSTGIDHEIAVTEQISFKGSGESAESVIVKEEGQKWVMFNVDGSSSLDLDEWSNRLGPWEIFPATTMNPNIIKNYYFKAIDLTIVGNVETGEVVTWKLGDDGL